MSLQQTQPGGNPFTGTALDNLAQRDATAAGRIEAALAEPVRVLAIEPPDPHNAWDLADDGQPIPYPRRTFTGRTLAEALVDALAEASAALVEVCGPEGTYDLLRRWHRANDVSGALLRYGNLLRLLSWSRDEIRQRAADDIEHVMSDYASWRRERDRVSAFVEAVRAAIRPAWPGAWRESLPVMPRVFAGKPKLQELYDLLRTRPSIRRNELAKLLYPDDPEQRANSNLRKLLACFKEELPRERQDLRIVETPGSRRTGPGEIRLERIV